MPHPTPPRPPHPGPGPSRSPTPAGTAADPRPLATRARPGRAATLAVLGLAAVGVAGAVTFGRPYLSAFLSLGGPADRADLIPHTVKRELLPVSVVERGTLESADNREVVCRVKAGSKGTFASTIKWVIDDGTVVSKNQLLMELDDSALQDQLRTQTIAAEKARAEWVTADANYVITLKQNESDVAAAEAALRVAELDVDKFLGVRADPARTAAGAVAGAAGTLAEKGEYRQRLDDVSGRLKLAEADLEAYRDRSAWAERSVKLKYLTPSQAKVEQAKLAGALDNVDKLRTEKYILEAFARRRDLTDLLSKLAVARLGRERVDRQAEAKLTQAESARRTAYSVYQQELDTAADIEQQVRECKVYAPQDGLVVYYKAEATRFGSTSQGLIAVGEQVKEGQKLMRIPDLKRMQVNTRVHEALVARIRGDDRRPTGFADALRVGLMAGPHAFSRVVGTSAPALDLIRDRYRDKEYFVAAAGQPARVRVDAFPDRVLAGHVRSVAAVASQADWASADVKVYQTLVAVDEPADGLKPDMSAEVTIQVDAAADPVLAVPLQAVVGGADAGPARRVVVLGPDGPADRPVVLGAFNDKMVEVREGLAEGDVVALNPRAVLGDAAKSPADGAPPDRGNPGGKGKGKGGRPKKADG